MSYSKVFLRAFFLVFLVFFVSGCASLEKEREQLQVLLGGKTFTVENKSEENIYLSLSEWSDENSTYERVRDLVDGGSQRELTISSYFLTERGSFNISSDRSSSSRRRNKSSSIILYEATITISGNQVTVVPTLTRYCRGRNRGTDIKGDPC